MKRAHRRIHLLAWIALAPIVAAGVFLALSNLPGQPQATLPEILSEGG